MSRAERSNTVRSPSRRAVCPKCGKSIACAYDWNMLTWLLRPHKAHGDPLWCKGWRVESSDLVPIPERSGDPR